jgi:DNA-binding response OmpR family regulator
MKKILLIEDNQEIRENIAEILTLANYEGVEAENGKVGVVAAKETQPDLIICDIMMPQLDGYGVLHLLSKNPATAGIPFIFLTAKSEKDDFRKGMNLGADDYLTKPFDDLELLDAVEMRLKKSESLKGEFQKSAEGLQAFIQEARGLEDLNKLISPDQSVSYVF